MRTCKKCKYEYVHLKDIDLQLCSKCEYRFVQLRCTGCNNQYVDEAKFVPVPLKIDVHLNKFYPGITNQFRWKCWLCYHLCSRISVKRIIRRKFFWDPLFKTC